MSETNPKNLDQLPANKLQKMISLLQSTVNYFYLPTAVAGFLCCLYLVADDAYWLKYFRPLTDGLEQIANVKMKTGTVLRKTIIDSLSLPILESTKIYNADLITTRPASQTEIQIGEQTTVLIKENSIVRLRRQNGKTLLRLSYGEVNLTSLTDQTIQIQRGSRTEDMMLRAGTYVLKIDSSFGIQITTFAQSLKIESASKRQSKGKMKAPEEAKDQSKQAKNTGDTKTEIAELPPLKASFDLPSPKDGTLFLRQNPKEIVIVPMDKCPDRCMTKLFKNHSLWKYFEFSSEQDPITRLQPNELDNGTYDMVFSSETKELRTRFVIKAFSETELSQAIEKGVIVEIQ